MQNRAPWMRRNPKIRCRSGALIWIRNTLNFYSTFYRPHQQHQTENHTNFSSKCPPHCLKGSLQLNAKPIIKRWWKKTQDSFNKSWKQFCWFVSKKRHDLVGKNKKQRKIKTKTFLRLPTLNNNNNLIFSVQNKKFHKLRRFNLLSSMISKEI